MCSGRVLRFGFRHPAAGQNLHQVASHYRRSGNICQAKPEPSKAAVGYTAGIRRLWFSVVLRRWRAFAGQAAWCRQARRSRQVRFRGGYCGTDCWAPLHDWT